MRRSFVPALGAVAALAAAGCTQNGGYRLSWTFYSTPESAVLQSPAEGCGRHGVDSIFATGTDGTGDAVQVIALCTPGQFTGSAPNGTWTFQIQMLDAQGALIKAPARPAGVPPLLVPAAEPISSGGPTAEFVFTLNPPDPCSTYIDDTRDGAVQTAAPGCIAQPGGGAPRDASPPPDGSAPRDASSPPDGSAPRDASSPPDGSGPRDASAQ
jgi:hypothetical protein